MKYIFLSLVATGIISRGSSFARKPDGVDVIKGKEKVLAQ